MNNFLNKALEEYKNKPQPLDFYHYVVMYLWDKRKDDNFVPNVLITKRISFLVANEKIISELKETLNKTIDNQLFFQYCSDFAKCFVNLQPLDDDDPLETNFRSSRHAYADVIEVYPVEERIRMINDFKERWKDKEV